MDLKRTRWVRRLEDGTYTIESNSTLSNEKVLCSLCGIASKCNINETRLKLRDAGVNFHLNSCARYVPLLAFRKPIIGLDTPYFNTMRSGVTWRDRLTEGRLSAWLKLILRRSFDSVSWIRFTLGQLMRC